jgi:hypothetical protein
MSKEEFQLPECFIKLGFKDEDYKTHYPHLLEVLRAYKRLSEEVRNSNTEGSETALKELSEAYEHCYLILTW